MRKMRNVCILAVLLMWGSMAHGESPPVLELAEGPNRIAIAVINQGGMDLYSVTIVVNQEWLPAWLDVSPCVERIRVPHRSRGAERLFLDLYVRDAPEGACAEVPLTLRDAGGGKWNFDVAAKVTSALPASNELSQNFPNPFNASSTIRYALVGEGVTDTKLWIFNALGQKVRTLVDAPQEAGFYSVVWDGRDDTGRQMSSGVYFCRMVTGDFVRVRKMLLVE